jgi:hypothetical protein
VLSFAMSRMACSGPIRSNVIDDVKGPMLIEIGPNGVRPVRSIADAEKFGGSAPTIATCTSQSLRQ